MQIPSAIPLRAVGHDDRLSVVDHLDELRNRLIVSLLAIAVAFGLCFWQNHRLLALMNTPLAHQTRAQISGGEGPVGAAYTVQRAARDLAQRLQMTIAAVSAQHPTLPERYELQKAYTGVTHDVTILSSPPRGDRPVTLSIGEPFTTTVTVSLIFALILSLPVILLQAYAFLAPAIEARHRRVVAPLAIAVPLLFITGAAFAYYVVLPAAVHFLQNFNRDEFNVLVQAAPYYKFAAAIVLAMGLLFELPIAILAITQAGILTTAQLRRNRRVAIAACALVATLLPGDLVTMLLETVPLYVLFEFSLLLAAVSERRRLRAGPGH